MSWTRAVGAQKSGEHYRVLTNIRAPYTIENIERIEDEWRRRAVAAGLDITSVQAFYPVSGQWRVEVRYTVLPFDVFGGIKLFADDVGRLAQNIIAGVVNATALASVVIEKEVVAVAGAAGTAAAAAVGPLTNAINPGVLVLVVLGIFLVTRRG